MAALVVAAHPDDEVLGAGGTMARLAAEGWRVTVLIVADGVGLRHPGATLQSVHDGARAANRVLDVTDVRFGGFARDGALLDSVPERALVDLIKGHLEEVRPHTLFFHHSDDLHADHRAVASAARYCCRAGALASPRRILSYEVLSSTECAGRGGFHPNLFYDIDDFLPRKLEAMKHYGAELHSFPNPRSLDSIAALARYRGGACSVAAAEGFDLLRELN